MCGGQGAWRREFDGDWSFEVRFVAGRACEELYVSVSMFDTAGVLVDRSVNGIDDARPGNSFFVVFHVGERFDVGHVEWVPTCRNPLAAASNTRRSSSVQSVPKRSLMRAMIFR